MTHDGLTDVPGLLVGHARGTTVVLAPPDGAVAGVDVRGIAPRTRETDLLDPGATVQRVHAVVLSGGGAHGLAAAHGVMEWLEERGRGFAVPGGVVPIVPAVAGAGPVSGARSDAATGRAAADAAGSGPVEQDGIGSASIVLDGGAVVAALIVRPALVVVATDVTLDKAGCRRLATMGHDGLARALARVSAALDGELVFGLSTAVRPAPDLPGLLALEAAAADVVTRAVRSVLPR